MRNSLVSPVLIYSLLALFAIGGCKLADPEPNPSPRGYDFNNGQKSFLINRLEEISGITFLPGNDTTLKAVNDEEGRVYTVDLRDSRSKFDHVKFGKSGDYEDLAFYAGRWFVLQSNGTIHTWDSAGGVENTKKLQVLPKGEYEGLCATEDGLYAICKNCKADPDTTVSIFHFKVMGDSLQLKATFKLQTAAVTPSYRKHFSPSAMAKHPITGQWYILSHLSKMLLVADENFNIVEIIPLSGMTFPQPEGIAFNSHGDMIISTEGDQTPANIQLFRYSSGK